MKDSSPGGPGSKSNYKNINIILELQPHPPVLLTTIFPELDKDLLIRNNGRHGRKEGERCVLTERLNSTDSIPCTVSCELSVTCGS
jgi:hypothetical protein